MTMGSLSMSKITKRLLKVIMSKNRNLQKRYTHFDEMIMINCINRLRPWDTEFPLGYYIDFRSTQVSEEAVRRCSSK